MSSSPHTRLEVFPKKMLMVSSGKLLCCSVTHVVWSLLWKIASSRITFPQSDILQGKKTTTAKVSAVVSYAEFGNHQKRLYLDGAGLSATVTRAPKLRRIEAATAMLKPGIPVSKLGHLSTLIKEHIERVLCIHMLAQSMWLDLPACKFINILLYKYCISQVSRQM